jgi:putative membrane protein insertion efficiency factor
MTQLILKINQFWNKTVGRVLVLALVGVIRSYQIVLSPRLGAVCRYYPSCSHYGLAAVTVHGAVKGTLLSAWRILRCHPWSAGGFDFVPKKGNWTNQEVIEISTNNDRQVTGV